LGEQIRVELRLGDSLPQLRLDGGAFEMILMNLVLNARDAMTGGGILRIRAAGVTIASEDAGLRGLRAPGTCLRLEVEDTGHGMDDATQARIFEPFFTTKGSGGTGLGLPAVYGAVRQAGGCIEVRSRPGQGACFTILLPEADGRRETMASAPEQVRGAERLVLVVEDEDAVRLLAARALTASGFKVVAACDAEEALRRLEREHLRPELLLTDVVMPGRSGLELALRARRHLPDLPVLLM
jgi:hypothetical protein